MVLFIAGAFLAAIPDDTAFGRSVGGLALVLFGGLVAMILVALFARRRQRERSEDITAGEPAPPVPSARRRDRRSERPVRSDREVRSGARDLATEPESEEAQTLKRRLSEAVADLADKVEEMPAAGEVINRGKTSEEMIAEAKRRIAERGRERDL